ncbi:hypothetical protein BDZ85DRAFT_258332 [Elsinoe ampelina]|uniref:Uncharacterized protein n=1 Tax=Elsinoe ampelina TaxID=302913 RepID=A0A6A6GJT0_9PEZI|nr:hypothetical protein BDZ85DRAFT_258332 [Elsinoe ampelina]
MVVYRPVLARGLAAARLARPVPSSLVRKGLRSGFRRGYASGHDAHPPSSDIPWLIGAIAVTVPGCYYLWPAPSHGDAHHGHDAHDEHDAEPETAEADDKEDADSESSDKEAEPEAKESESKDEPAEEPKDDSKDESPKDESADDSEDKGDSKDESSGAPEKTSNKKVDGVQFKGKTSAGDENNEMQDTRKREPDSKGAFKKRIDSAYQKDLGPAQPEGKRPEGATATPPSGNPGSIESKQAGLSNTATRHSTQIDQDPEKSKKAEGVPDTAKSTTTIDPGRPAK